MIANNGIMLQPKQEFVVFNNEIYYLQMQFVNNSGAIANLMAIDLDNSGCVADFGDGEPIYVANGCVESHSPATNVTIYSKNGLKILQSTLNEYDFAFKNIPDTVENILLDSQSTAHGSTGELPRSLTDLTLKGNTTLAGDVKFLPTELTELYVYGNTTLFGNCIDLPRKLEHIYVYGANTISGNIQDLPGTINELYAYGDNTIGGTVTNFRTNHPSSRLITITGNNTVGGDLAGTTGITSFVIVGNSQFSEYTSGTIFNTNYSVIIVTDSSYGLSSANVDALLHDLNASLVANRTITLLGGMGGRTSISDTDVEDLTNRGCTVTTNMTN